MLADRAVRGFRRGDGLFFEPVTGGLGRFQRRRQTSAQFGDRLPGLPSRIQLPDVMAVVGMALVLSLLATIYPAWRAARLDPIEALRYE